MERPQTITIEGNILYNAKEIYNYDKRFYVGCIRVRLMIENKNLQETDYMFYYKKSNVWIRSTASYCRATMYLTEAYVLGHIPKMMSDAAPMNPHTENPAASHMEPHAENPAAPHAVKSLYKYEEAPPILDLDNSEKFKDAAGNIIQIEVRGERNPKQCYFRVKDVSAGFGMPNLKDVLIHKECKYEENNHYKCFNITKATIGRFGSSKKSNGKILYLTYKGMLKVLFCSRTGNAEAFTDWATEKLFTIQMGERPQRDELAGELIGAHAQAIRDVFRANSAKTPCVYLYKIGSAADLLDGGNHTGDDILCKFGCTDDFPRRAAELEALFKKEFGVAHIELLQFSIIEAQYIHAAEASIAQYFRANSVEWKTMRELVVITPRELSGAKQHYTMIQHSYIGRFKELTDRIHAREMEITDLRNQLVLKDKDMLLKDKDMELFVEKHKYELSQKDVEILTLKLSAARA